jgi:acetamidase/formamidase
MSIDLKDACKKCPKYKTCTEPWFFASAIADDILDISMKKYHAQMRDYTGLKDGKVLDFCGRETPLSGMLHSVDTLEFLESIESDEPSPEDILAGDIDTEDLPSGASVFLDVLKHGRDYKRVADNHGTTYDNVKSMHLKITKKSAKHPRTSEQVPHPPTQPS